jgi:hypothetical protein
VTYVFGRGRLGEAWGFLAGWSFIIGKTASCAAIALTFESYVFPDLHRAGAALAVIVLTSINYAGIRKTALATKPTVAFVVAALLVLVIALFAAGDPQLDRLVTTTGDVGPVGVLQAAGFLFFAFAGYARIATVGEEVKDPERTIPRAIPLALVIVVALYGAVAVSALLTVPQATLASSSTPLATAIRSTNWDFLVPVVDVAAAVATLGVLLSLLAGVSRTVFEMASNNHLPSYLAAVHPKNRVPHRAEIAVGLAVAAIVLLGWRQIVRDRMALAATFLLPVVVGALMVSIYEAEDPDARPIRLGVVSGIGEETSEGDAEADRTSAGAVGEAVVGHLDESPVVDVHSYGDRASLERAIRLREVEAGLLIPPGTGERTGPTERGEESGTIQLLGPPTVAAPGGVRAAVEGAVASDAGPVVISVGWCGHVCPPPQRC